MPVYEFYCPFCNTIFNFFSRAVNTEKIPACPKCQRDKMQKQVSVFAVTGRANEDSGPGDELPIDETKMEKAMETLATEAGSINEDDPRQAGQLMRKLTNMTGMELSGNMEEALKRLESGENPEKIEADMGDSLENETPFIMPGKKKGHKEFIKPRRDDTLYEM